MRNRSKLLFTGLCAALILAAAVSTASANHLSTNSQTFVLRWTALTFEASTGARVTCGVSLGGSFHSRTIAKVANALIGNVNAAAITSSTCTGGTATVNRETLPWHVQYRSFAGTLPNITNVALNLVGARFRIQPTGEIACNAGTTQNEPGIGTIGFNARHVATEVRASGTIALSGSFLCNFASGSFSGTGTVTTPAGGEIIVTLI